MPMGLVRLVPPPWQYGGMLRYFQPRKRIHRNVIEGYRFPVLGEGLTVPRWWASQVASRWQSRFRFPINASRLPRVSLRIQPSVSTIRPRHPRRHCLHRQRQYAKAGQAEKLNASITSPERDGETVYRLYRSIVNSLENFDGVCIIDAHESRSLPKSVSEVLSVECQRWRRPWRVRETDEEWGKVNSNPKISTAQELNLLFLNMAADFVTTFVPSSS